MYFYGTQIRNMKNPLILLFLVIFSASNSFAQSVTIGTQTWTTKNLNVATFRNGDLIPEVKTNEEWEAAGENKQPAWCYYENNTANGIKYGKLYNWYAVNDYRGLAPAGWHVPTYEEWQVLSTFLGGDDVAGIKMKSSYGWSGYGCAKCNGKSTEFKKICSACKGWQVNSSEPISGNGTNSSGFAGLPGGIRVYGNFYDVGASGDWWSSSDKSETGAWQSALISNFSILARQGNDKTKGFSVRCVKD